MDLAFQIIFSHNLKMVISGPLVSELTLIAPQSMRSTPGRILGLAHNIVEAVHCLTRGDANNSESL